VKALRTRWAACTERERLALRFGALGIFLAACYALIVDPGGTARSRLDHEVPVLTGELVRMRQAAGEVATLRAKSVAVPVDAAALRSAVVESARRHGVAVRAEDTDLEPAGTLRVRCAPTSAAGILDWLHDLHTRRGVQVVEADLRSSDGALSGVIRFASVQ